MRLSLVTLLTCLVLVTPFHSHGLAYGMGSSDGGSHSFSPGRSSVDERMTQYQGQIRNIFYRDWNNAATLAQKNAELHRAETIAQEANDFFASVTDFDARNRNSPIVGEINQVVSQMQMVTQKIEQEKLLP